MITHPLFIGTGAANVKRSKFSSCTTQLLLEKCDEDVSIVAGVLTCSDVSPSSIFPPSGANIVTLIPLNSAVEIGFFIPFTSNSNSVDADRFPS